MYSWILVICTVPRRLPFPSSHIYFHTHCKLICNIIHLYDFLLPLYIVYIYYFAVSFLSWLKYNSFLANCFGILGLIKIHFLSSDILFTNMSILLFGLYLNMILQIFFFSQTWFFFWNFSTRCPPVISYASYMSH